VFEKKCIEENMNITKKILEIHHTSRLYCGAFQQRFTDNRYFWYLKYSFPVKGKLFGFF